MKTRSIGFIGGGNMATSLISGLIASGYSPQKIWVSDTNEATLKSHAEHLQVNTTVSNEVVIASVEVVVLAVKPQVLHEVARQIAQLTQQKKVLIVSIAAGISQYSLAQWLGDDVAIVRCMPNTPALVLTGATVLHANQNVNNEQKDLAENILRSVGLALWVEDETQLDAVTAVSGSGPAYFFLLMEAMEKAALDMGLDERTARLLIQQTALGAAKIALESTESPTLLRERVTSPGGTTQKAIETFQQNDFTGIVSKALHAARIRSIEMSKQLGDN
ncbi:pyrroline-5-carboxylate reductase [Methylomonas sp. AM2-LC]|uniref:pyrroline-5-carboxylate reductase n=1 Tax=Methylomonas sp. AM2-LC TaxID=3153301 RepID=UPI0032668BEB